METPYNGERRQRRNKTFFFSPTSIFFSEFIPFFITRHDCVELDGQNNLPPENSPVTSCVLSVLRLSVCRSRCPHLIHAKCRHENSAHRPSQKKKKSQCKMYCGTICSKNMECRSMFLNYLLINGKKCVCFFHSTSSLHFFIGKGIQVKVCEAAVTLTSTIESAHAWVQEVPSWCN